MVCQGDVSCLYIKFADLLCKAAISSIFFGRSEQKPHGVLDFHFWCSAGLLGGLVLPTFREGFIERCFFFFRESLLQKGSTGHTVIYFVYLCDHSS